MSTDNTVEKRRQNMKQSEPKYTDATRTSSASFKPPMSRETLAKPNAPQTHEPTSSWFSPLSYIKGMLGSKPGVTASPSVTTEASNGKTATNSNKKKLANKLTESNKPAKKTEESSRTIQTKSNVVVEPPLLTDGSGGTARDRQEHNPPQPRFSFSPKEVLAGNRKQTLQEVEEHIDPAEPKYNPLHGENKSTILHMPDKKGTTSYRITTTPNVSSRPGPTLNAPISNTANSPSIVSNDAKLMRKKSASPRRDSISKSSRLRSKSTSDHGNTKSEPVSHSTYQKSQSLKPTSQKHVRQFRRNVNEIGHQCANVKSSPKPSLFIKPTILDGQTGFSESIRAEKINQTTKGSGSPKALLTLSSRATKDRSGNNTRVAFKKTETPSVISPTKLKEKSYSRVETHQTLSNIKYPTFPKPTWPHLKASQSSTTPAAPVKKKESTNDPVTKYIHSLTRQNRKLKTRLTTSTPTITHSQTRTTSNDRSLDKTLVFKHLPSPTVVSSIIACPDVAEPVIDISSNRNGNTEQTKLELCKASPSPRQSPSVIEKIMTKVNPDNTNVFELHPDPNTKFVPTSPAGIELQGRDIRSSITKTIVTSGGEICVAKLDSSTEPTRPNFVEEKQNFYHSALPSILHPTILNMAGEETEQVSPNICDLSNSATHSDDHFGYNNFEIDVFDDNRYDFDICNSALPRKLEVGRKGKSIPPTCLLSETDDDKVYGVAFGPSLVVPKDDIIETSQPITETLSKKFIPSYKKEETQSIKFIENGVPIVQSTTANNFRRKKLGKDAEHLHRKYPIEVDMDKKLRNMSEDLKVDSKAIKYGKTPIIKKERSKSTGSESLFPSPYIGSAKKQSTESKVVEISNPIDDPPEDLTPNNLKTQESSPKTGKEAKSSSSYTSVKKVISPYHSPTMKAVASSFGEALEKFASVFHRSSPRTGTLPKAKPSTTIVTQISPKKAQIGPTVIVEKPLSATLTYLSSLLDKERNQTKSKPIKLARRKLDNDNQLDPKDKAIIRATESFQKEGKTNDGTNVKRIKHEVSQKPDKGKSTKAETTLRTADNVNRFENNKAGAKLDNELVKTSDNKELHKRNYAELKPNDNLKTVSEWKKSKGKPKQKPESPLPLSPTLLMPTEIGNVQNDIPDSPTKRKTQDYQNKRQSRNGNNVHEDILHSPIGTIDDALEMNSIVNQSDTQVKPMSIFDDPSNKMKNNGRIDKSCHDEHGPGVQVSYTPDIYDQAKYSVDLTTLGEFP